MLAGKQHRFDVAHVLRDRSLLRLCVAHYKCMRSVYVRRGMNPRGAGCVFGGDIVAQFCHRNDVQMIARSHQLVMEGFKFMFDERLVTVYSAPNYMGRCGHVGAILQLDEHCRSSFLVFDGEPNHRDHWGTITRHRLEVGEREDGISFPDHWVRRDPATEEAGTSEMLPWLVPGSGRQLHPLPRWWGR